MYIDWVVLASVLTVIALIWMLAYAAIYAFNHIAKDTAHLSEGKNDPNGSAILRVKR